MKVQNNEAREKKDKNEVKEEKSKQETTAEVLFQTANHFQVTG
ncbi:MAG: hypothetical protein O4861_16045 [Trichodesmium sp. St16_bin4-tuft]|nr:hypothetical protein [Trichodesmium sp. St4_bin8_1]MDE5072945.1 hypothetical protein [Trichodesmium sp. St5_bin8]MDE5099759.1 hypothetical protein [Trichodesmium sp. St16_bin4-tuft]